MKQEMRKLNRAKYARTIEEMAQLAAQGYVPVGTAAADTPDAASGQKDKKTGQPSADPGRKNKKAAPSGGTSGREDKKTEQPAAAPDQEGSSAEQTAERPDQAAEGLDQAASVPELPTADPAQAGADGGGNGT